MTNNVVEFDNKNKTVKDLLDNLNDIYTKGEINSLAVAIVSENHCRTEWSSTDNKFEMIGAVNRLQYKLQEDM